MDLSIFSKNDRKKSAKHQRSEQSKAAEAIAPARSAPSAQVNTSFTPLTFNPLMIIRRPSGSHAQEARKHGHDHRKDQDPYDDRRDDLLFFISSLHV